MSAMESSAAAAKDDCEAQSSSGGGRSGPGEDGGESYEERVARSYFEIARAEGGQEDALDEIASLQRQLEKLRTCLSRVVSSVAKTKLELEAADAELGRAAAEQVSEDEARMTLEKRLVGVREDARADRDGDGAALETIHDLIRTKTQLAEATEERDRRHLEKKRIEERLAKVKYDLAMILAANDDDDATLQIVRHDHEQLESQLREAKGLAKGL